MEILTLREHDQLTAFEQFLHAISTNLAANICKKLSLCTEAHATYSHPGLKILNPRIWGYKGTIYKLRVDCGKESARVLFAKTPGNDMVLLHGFLKKTRKTPKKDARIALKNYERLKKGAALVPLSTARYRAG